MPEKYRPSAVAGDGTRRVRLFQNAPRYMPSDGEGSTCLQCGNFPQHHLSDERCPE
jgi:hypothetical protein